MYISKSRGGEPLAVKSKLESHIEHTAIKQGHSIKRHLGIVLMLGGMLTALIIKIIIPDSEIVLPIGLVLPLIGLVLHMESILC